MNEIDHWLERLFWIAMVSIPFLAIWAGRIATLGTVGITPGTLGTVGIMPDMPGTLGTVGIMPGILVTDKSSEVVAV